MKWFKHDTDGHRSEKLAAIRAQFGFEGIGWWFTILEMVAEKMDETDRCDLELPIKDWCAALSTKPQKFRTYLDVLSQIGRTSAEHRQNIGLCSTSESEKCGICYVSVKIPNLLKKRDEHTSRLGSKSGQTPVQERRAKSEDTDKEKETLSTGVESEERREQRRSSPVKKNFPKANYAHNGNGVSDRKTESCVMFVERVQEFVTITDSDKAGIMFDLSHSRDPSELDWILEQLQAAKTDGRLSVEHHGIRNPVGWIRKQIQTANQGADRS